MKKATMFTVFGMALLVTMGISSIIPALPLMSKFYGIPLEQSWRIIASFALPGLICIPFVGVWADRYGRKRVLLPALALFIFGGLGCMFARTYLELLFWRMIQGAGSAPLGLLYPTIIADTWQGSERVRIMSLTAMVLGLGTALSPALGGALAMLHWKLPFILPILGLPVAFMAVRIPLMRPGNREPFLRYVKNLIRTARRKQTIILLGLTLLTFIMLSGPIITCFPILAESVFQATPLESGLILASASLASGLAATRLPKLYSLFSCRALLLTSFALYSIAFCSIPLAPFLWALLLPIFIYGIAQGMNIPLVSLLLTEQAPDEQRAALMAANAVLLRLGQNIGPAVFGTLAGIIGPGAAIMAGTPVALAMSLLVLQKSFPSSNLSQDDGHLKQMDPL